MDWEENEQQPKMQPKEVCVFVVFFFQLRKSPELKTGRD